jgi:hypothetical protein
LLINSGNSWARQRSGGYCKELRNFHLGTFGGKFPTPELGDKLQKSRARQRSVGERKEQKDSAKNLGRPGVSQGRPIEKLFPGNLEREFWERRGGTA